MWLTVINLIIPFVKKGGSKLFIGVLVILGLFLYQEHLKSSSFDKGYQVATTEIQVIHNKALQESLQALNKEYKKSLRVERGKANVAQRALQELSEASKEVEIKYVNKDLEIDDCKPLLDDMSGVFQSHYAGMPSD